MQRPGRLAARDDCVCQIGVAQNILARSQRDNGIVNGVQSINPLEESRYDLAGGNIFFPDEAAQRGRAKCGDLAQLICLPATGVHSAAFGLVAYRPMPTASSSRICRTRWRCVASSRDANCTRDFRIANRERNPDLYFIAPDQDRSLAPGTSFSHGARW